MTDMTDTEITWAHAGPDQRRWLLEERGMASP